MYQTEEEKALGWMTRPEKLVFKVQIYKICDINVMYSTIVTSMVEKQQHFSLSAFIVILLES